MVYTTETFIEKAKYDNYEKWQVLLNLWIIFLKIILFLRNLNYVKKYIVLKEKKVYNSIAEAEKDNKLKTGSRITEVLKD